MPAINEKIVLNFKDIRKALEKLPKNVSKRVVRRALYAGATVVRDAARAKVPVQTGALRASIVARASSPSTKASSLGGNELVASVGIARKKFLRGKRKGKYPRRYAHIVEFGSRRMAARPFMRPALDTQIDSILGTIAAKMREGINEEAARLKRGGG